MKIGPLSLTLHRTIRVPDGRQPAQLPPSTGIIKTYNVKDYRENCPASWEDDAVFVALHSVEAMWISFSTSGSPLALLVGAGGVNALTGKKLGTKLEQDNYMVAPTQPWLDGWKNTDGSVYQFVATEHKGGEGNTVGEQILGAESKTGGIGIAVFEAKDPTSLKPKHNPKVGWSDGIYYSDTSYGSKGLGSGPVSTAMAANPMRSARSMTEMGVGKGGKITQKIYADPHGITVWNDAPVATAVIYLVDAATAEEITGEKVPAPQASENYHGKWFGMDDEKETDITGTEAFTGLKTAFPGDTSNVAAVGAADTTDKE